MKELILITMLSLSYGTFYDVFIEANSFSPNTLIIVSGDTVRWTNTDNWNHTTSADNGEAFIFVFSESGVFNYHCNIHSSMIGSISVNESE